MAFLFLQYLYSYGPVATSDGGFQVTFDVASVGAGTTNADVVARIPLGVNLQVTSVVVICPVNPGNATFNIMSGEGVETGSVAAAGAIVGVGQQMFTTDQLLPTGATVGQFAPSTICTWPYGTDMTLRIGTVGTGIGNCKVTISGIPS